MKSTCDIFLLFFSSLTRDDRENIKFGKKSKVGTGGMDSKLNAATWALDRGVSVVICNGSQDNAIKTIVGGRKVGTFFTENTSGKKLLKIDLGSFVNPAFVSPT